MAYSSWVGLLHEKATSPSLLEKMEDPCMQKGFGSILPAKVQAGMAAALLLALGCVGMVGFAMTVGTAMNIVRHSAGSAQDTIITPFQGDEEEPACPESPVSPSKVGSTRLESELLGSNRLGSALGSPLLTLDPKASGPASLPDSGVLSAISKGVHLRATTGTEKRQGY